MDITSKNKAALSHYKAVKPNHLGDLHERMRYVMERLRAIRPLVEKHQDNELNEIFHELWVGTHDLAGEVQYTTPDKPPNGKRLMKTL